GAHQRQDRRWRRGSLPAARPGDARRQGDSAMTATATTSVRVDAWGQTDIGLRRTVNQDHFVILRLFKAAEVRQSSVADPGAFQALHGPEGWLFIVADGVGGQPGGELASATAVT